MKSIIILLVFIFYSCLSELRIQKILNKTFYTPFDYRTGGSTLKFTDSSYFYTAISPFISTSIGTWRVNPNKKKEVILETDSTFMANFAKKPHHIIERYCRFD